MLRRLRKWYEGEKLTAAFIGLSRIRFRIIKISVRQLHEGIKILLYGNPTDPSDRIAMKKAIDTCRVNLSHFNDIVDYTESTISRYEDEANERTEVYQPQ